MLLLKEEIQVHVIAHYRYRILLNKTLKASTGYSETLPELQFWLEITIELV
jgi:hypothetical protein